MTRRAFDLSEIQSGLDNGEFFLEYLPIVSLEQNRCIGAEALIRWRHPSGVVGPIDFIPVVEETPLSGLITYWVIETVARELGSWLRIHDDAALSINIPPELIGRGGIAYAIKQAELGDVIHKIIFEITERGLPDHIGIAAMKDAHKAGVRIALDDVWVNEVSPAILCRTRTDIVKIEKAFLDEMLLESWSPSKMQVFSNLVRTSNIEVIAEGVESVVQLDILRAAGIHMAQGWYFSRPLSSQHFEAFFAVNQQLAFDR